MPTPLELPAEFYRLEALERAAAAFAHLAAIRVEAGGDRHLVHLEPLAGADPEVLSRELANWALAATALERDPEPPSERPPAA